MTRSWQILCKFTSFKQRARKHEQRLFQLLASTLELPTAPHSNEQHLKQVLLFWLRFWHRQYMRLRVNFRACGGVNYFKPAMRVWKRFVQRERWLREASDSARICQQKHRLRSTLTQWVLTQQRLQTMRECFTRLRDFAPGSKLDQLVLMQQASQHFRHRCFSTLVRAILSHTQLPGQY